MPNMYDLNPGWYREQQNYNWVNQKPESFRVDENYQPIEWITRNVFGQTQYGIPTDTTQVFDPGLFAGDMWSQYQGAYDEGLQANKDQEAAVMGGWQNLRDKSAADAAGSLAEAGALHDRSMGYLQGQGATESSDINRAYRGLETAQGQDLVSRGLAGTTIKPTMEAGIERDRLSAQGGLNERLNRQYLDTDIGTTQSQLAMRESQRREDQGLAGQKLGAMERVTNAYPGMSEMFNYMLEMGKSGMLGDLFGTK